MAINLYGNVSGTYQKPNIDLFEMARKQNNQPVKFCDTEAGKNLPAIKVNISKEGLRALHGSKMKGSVDIQKQMEEMQYISEHQPVESFSRVMQNSYVQFSESNSDEKMTIQKKADVLLGEFKSICDEINSGYDGGTRVRFIEDSTSTDGFRKLSKDDELSILLSEFSNFVEGRFGKTHQEESEKVAKIVNDLQKVKQEMGRGDIRYYEPEYIPSDFVEKLLKTASDYIKAQKEETEVQIPVYREVTVNEKSEFKEEEYAMNFFENTRQPQGFGGKLMTKMMNIGHAKLSQWGFSNISVNPDAAVLDVGCGGGANIAAWLGKCGNGHVTGMDYSKVSVAESQKLNAAAIKQGKCCVVQGDVSAIPFPDAVFDYVSAFETVYFWPGLKKCFFEVNRVLKNGGTFLICNESDGTNDADEKWTKLIDGMKIYTSDQLIAALKEAGFTEIKTYSNTKNHWISIVATKQPISSFEN